MTWTSSILDLVRSVGILLSMFLTVAQLWMFWRVFCWWAYERPGINRGGSPQPKILLRRLWCQHRHLVKTRDPFGRHIVACARCSTEVNAGKPSEWWR